MEKIINITEIEDTISSGFTRSMEEKKDCWYENEPTQHSELRDWEDLLEYSTTEELIKELKPIPFYRYIVRYVIYRYIEDMWEYAAKHSIIRDQEKKWLESLISQAYTEIEKKSRAKDSIINLVRDIVFKEFLKNAYFKKANGEIKIYGSLDCKILWDKKKLKDKLTAANITSEVFFVLALGLNMQYEDVELFLKKALKRNSLNLWDEKEMLLYVSFRHFGGDNKWKFYLDSYENYKNAVPEQGTALQINEDFSTVVIKNTADALMEKINSKFRGLSSVNHEFKEFLRQYKFMMEHKEGYKHTAVKRFIRLYQEMSTVLKDDMEQYYQGGKEYATGIVTLYYADSKKSLYVPKGTKFRANIGSGDKREYIEFVSTANITGKAYPDGKMDQEIPVVCTKETKKLADGAKEVGYQKKNTKFTTNSSDISEIYNKSKFKTPTKTPVGSVTHVRGKLQARVRCGMKIPEGTIFTANGMDYESVQTIVCKPSVDVPVECCISDCKISKKQVNEWQNSLKNVQAISSSAMGFGRTRKSILKYLYFPVSQKEGVNYMDVTIENMDQFIEGLSYILEGNRITDSDVSNILNGQTDNINREKLLTLQFLVLMGYFQTDKKESQDKSRKELFAERYDKLFDAAQTLLNDCGFMGMYLPNPYDCMLAYLTTCEEPVNAFRNLWGIYLKEKGRMEGRN